MIQFHMPINCTQIHVKTIGLNLSQLTHFWETVYFEKHYVL